MPRCSSLLPAAAVAAIALPACGGAEEATSLPSRYALLGRRADVSELTYTIEGRGEAELARACKRWAELGAGFRPARAGEIPDFTVTWEHRAHGACMPFGMDTSVAHTGPLEPAGTSTFVHLDAARAWDTEDGPSLSQALLHELGHVLGLDHGPDPESLMFADPGSEHITQADRDAFWTLYGGGDIDAADVVVSRGGETLAVVHGVATPGRTDFELFDTDGDGDDELVVWRTDPEGSGEITAFHFVAGPLPEHTRGPRLGMTDSSATIDLLIAAGERVLVVQYPNGNRTVRRFDDDGHLHALSEEGIPALGATPERRREGDLDGDGVLEHVARGSRSN